MIGNGIDFAAKFGRAGGPRRTKSTQADQGLALETARKTAHWKSMGYKAVCKSIAAALLLSACTATDWCHDNREAVRDCLELKRLGKVAECRCEAKASGAVTASTPDRPDHPKPPRDDDDDEEPDEEPGPHDHSEPGDDGGVPHDEDDPRYHPKERVVVVDNFNPRGRW